MAKNRVTSKGLSLVILLVWAAALALAAYIVFSSGIWGSVMSSLSGNLIQNGSFEDWGAGGSPTYWQISSGTATKSAEAASGKYALKLSGVISQSITGLTSGGTYQVSLNSYGAGAEVGLSYSYKKSDGTLSQSVVRGSVPGRSSYGATTFKATLPSGSQIDGVLAIRSTGGTVWVDDVVIVPESLINDVLRPSNRPTSQAGGKIYWGAYIVGGVFNLPNNSPWDLVYSNGDTTGRFESDAGKKVSIIHWGQPWYNSKGWPNGYYPFSAQLMSAVRNHGSIPMLDWGSWDLGNGTPNQPDFALKNVARGNYSFGGQTFDQYVTSFAQAAKSWGNPFFLRFDWEMNGWWQFPWSAQLNGNTAGDYVAAWRHVHDIFKSVGATNVTWVWCPNISSSGSGHATTPYNQLYPGDSYVDWTCFDGYNQAGDWLSFREIFSGNGGYIKNSYNEMIKVAPMKPIMVGETASVEAGDGGGKKAAWETDALLTQLPTTFPQIGALVWFNWNGGNNLATYPVESTSLAQTGFASGIGSAYFAANDFANLSGGVIQPLARYSSILKMY